ncbi:MAG TPA: hypothetical protein VIC08_08635 [Cellvibrionaceae bacterium]
MIESRRALAQAYLFLPRALLSIAIGALAACGGSGSPSPVGSGDQQPDPVVVDLPVAFIQRPLMVEDEDGGEPQVYLLPAPDQPLAFNPGASLWLKPRATHESGARDISSAAFVDSPGDGAGYDVKNLSVHPDGDRLLFTLRAPMLEDVDEDEQPSWNIWEYNLPLDSLRRVITSDIVAEAGDDITPRYLADGRIVFASTRQVRSRAILLDDNKAQYAAESEFGDGPALLLHSMNADGTDIRQLSYNQSHDWNPLLLDNGRLLYQRRDNYGNNRLSYYTARPDGTDVRLHYGYHSLFDNDTPWLFNPQVMPNGKLVGIYKPRESVAGGDMAVLDQAQFVEPELAVLPGTPGEAVEPLTVLPIVTDGGISRHGYFSALSPLYDGTNRLLVSWSQCRLSVPDENRASGERLVPCTEDWLANEEATAADPLFGLWIYQLDSNVQLPVVTPREGVIYTEVATVEPRAPMPYLAPQIDTNLAEEGLGALHIRSVYDIDGIDATSEGIATLRDPAQTPANARPARFLRLVKAVSLPPDDILNFPGSAFGFSGGERMKEILGYVPIEPDGSVKVAVPADVAFTLSIVDAAGRRISARHRNWLQLRPGETFECSGCHERDSGITHGRPEAAPASINTGAETSGLPFANTEPALVADMGETMAEVYARIVGLRHPTVDIDYSDDWTDPDVRAKTPDFAYRYAELHEVPDPDQVPTSEACQIQWQAGCRIVINYATHIQPLWEKPRQQFDASGELLADYTCTSCHSPADADGLVQLPAGQLDLTASANDSPHITSYRQLLATRFELELVEGILQEVLIESGEFETDEEGELILDADGNPIPILVRVPISRTMAPGGAFASARFFNRLSTFNSEESTVDHRGWLNSAELKLLAEWLDIGAQYYNNPFDVPD